MGSYYDFLEYWTLRDKIVWTKATKLKWSDFLNSDDEIGLYAKVGLSLDRAAKVYRPQRMKVSSVNEVLKIDSFVC
ncbi:hypothetical protein [Flagellimonas sp. CMM7]|uniref:hypothetical protein n=1 Tax=Flagellimonas sp. CMM7 TaxID=2654676 RepID=UPI0013D14A2E|nr:hypothetical protein [Flagellimonas sp. CMM7]UII80403.1 hypothetical protein LV704_02545 [Flagellimonas sp. CMM7]